MTTTTTTITTTGDFDLNHDQRRRRPDPRWFLVALLQRRSTIHQQATRMPMSVRFPPPPTLPSTATWAGLLLTSQLLLLLVDSSIIASEIASEICLLPDRKLASPLLSCLKPTWISLFINFPPAAPCALCPLAFVLHSFVL